MIRNGYTYIIAGLLLISGCSSFRNTAEFNQYRSEWDTYETANAEFSQRQAECIAQKQAEELAEQKAKEDEEKRRQDEAAARKAAYASNPIIIHNRKLRDAFAQADLQIPSSIRALSDSLEAFEIDHIENMNGTLQHRFAAKQAHCYLALGLKPNGIAVLKGHWQTSDPLGYQTYSIPFYQTVELPALSGICTTSETELAYMLSDSDSSEIKAIYFFEWSKDNMPDWLQAQITVNIDHAICHPLRWKLLWQRPIPGTMYYYNDEPVLRTDYLPNNAKGELATYAGKFYSLVPVLELRTTSDRPQLPEGFVHSCSERPIMYPGMSICSDNMTVSTACCIENSKQKVTPEMSESNARLHYCGGSSGEVHQSMEQASKDIHAWIFNKRQLETFDIVKMTESLTSGKE